MYLLKRASFVARQKKDSRFDLPNRQVLREWDGLASQRTGRKESVWQKIVRFADHYGVDPTQVVKGAFWHWSEHHTPLPNDLLRPEVIEQARTYEGDWRKDLHYRIEHAKSEMLWMHAKMKKYSADMSEQELAKYALVTPEIAVTPIIRYCLAMKAGLGSVAESYREAALSEYLTEMDGYDAAMGTMIPEELRAAGRRRLEEVIAQLGE